jgi:hypothetical protein
MNTNMGVCVRFYKQIIRIRKKKKKETRNKKKHNHTKEECQELMWPQRENFTKQLGKLQ